MNHKPTMVDGLFQEVRGGVWFVKRVVPAELRQRLGRSTWKISTKSRDYARARHVRDDLWGRWDAEIVEARKLGSAPTLSEAQALDLIEGWRWSRCALASNAGWEFTTPEGGTVMVDSFNGPAISHTTFLIPSPVVGAAAAGPAQVGAATWARWHFKTTGQPRGTMPFGVGLLVGRLQAAGRAADGWTTIDGFDDHLDAVVACHSTSRLTEAVRRAVRQPFARAWLEVAQHEEAERRRADAILTAMESVALDVQTIRAAAAPSQTYEPREGDKTIGEMLEAFKMDQDNPPLWQKQYGHISRTLGEIIGLDTPIRAVTVLDVRAVRRFLETLPTHVGKRFSEKPLALAAERAEIEGLPLLAPNTVRSYVIALKGIFEFARDPARGWLDRNPVDGEVPSKCNLVRRHGLTPDQLTLVFSRLDDARAEGSGHFWVPAILTWMGARANEIAQLHVDDIKEEGGVAFIDLEVFADDGRRLDRRRIKTDESARCIPIHKEIVDAGFLDLVEARRANGESQVFPDLKQNSLGYYSHDISRRWGRLLDDVGLTAPALTLHSLRHGWKEAAGHAHLPTFLVATLGGWGSSGVGEGRGSALIGYGKAVRAAVPANKVAMDAVRLGDFTLARTSSFHAVDTRN
ncbi:hypothetical protein BH09PSE1_BH09PSE1_25050 [soil metagenome]